MLTPLAPLRALPLRLTVLLPTVVTVEPSAAIEELSSPAAVTLSIWLSRSCFFVCLSGEGLVVFWPKTAEPLTRTEAATRVHANLFILPPWAWLTTRPLKQIRASAQRTIERATSQSRAGIEVRHSVMCD